VVLPASGSPFGIVGFRVIGGTRYTSDEPFNWELKHTNFGICRRANAKCGWDSSSIMRVKSAMPPM